MSEQLRVRNLLEKQILSDAREGDTTVLASILEALSDDVAYASLSDANQNNLNYQYLKGGENLQALKDVRCISNCWDKPEGIAVASGTIIQAPHSAANNGDCFANLVSGVAVKTLRGHYEGEKRDLTRGDVIGLSEGYKSQAYSLGCIDLRVWKVIS